LGVTFGEHRIQVRQLDLVVTKIVRRVEGDGCDCSSLSDFLHFPASRFMIISLARRTSLA
jgi:hypothetical protein